MDFPSKVVTITVKSTAVSATPVRPGKTYPLSVLDHAMAKHRLSLVFYFRSPIDRDRLKESLSDVLSHYPVVTGRVGREEEGNFVVKCNDAGVRVLDATVAVELEEWLRGGGGGEEKELVYSEEMGEDASIWSPFCVQISEFKNSGFAIGLTCPHMYSDPTCAILLIKAWSDAHRRACIINPPFFHPPGLKGRPRPNTDTVSVAILENKSKLPHPSPAKMSTVTFRLDGESVRRCLAEIKQSSPEATPFEALAALFWWRIGSDTMEICIDFRKRMHAPLPHGFFGNALHFSLVVIDDECRGNDTWGKLAKKVRTHIAGLEEEEEYWSAIDWFEGRRDKKTGKYGEPFQMYGPTLSCLMLDHVFAYETMFDDKGPAHVSCSINGHVDGEGMVLVMPHPDDKDGRTVAVTLPSDRTDQICRDEVILRMGPTFVVGAGV